MTGWPGLGARWYWPALRQRQRATAPNGAKGALPPLSTPCLLPSPSHPLQGRSNLKHLAHLPLAADLVRGLIAAQPGARPPMPAVMCHPLWWDVHRQLGFLIDVSDRVEGEDRAVRFVCSVCVRACVLGRGREGLGVGQEGVGRKRGRAGREEGGQRMRAHRRGPG